MVQRRHLSEREKRLLTALGSCPDLSMKELLELTAYRRTSSLIRKINQFKEQNFLTGPVYRADWGKLCRNPIYNVQCIVELGKSLDTVVEYLQIIEPLVWVYHVLSPHKDLLNVGYLLSDNTEFEALLQLLKDNRIITGYSARVFRTRIIRENPNFFGDPIPSLDNLLEPCEFPDLSVGHYDTEWSECDIRTLSYLQGGYKSIKLMEILRNERKLHNREWTYEQIKYSFRKICTDNLIKKIYYIYPFPLDECSDFFLFIKTDDSDLTKRIIYNFARGGRIYRQYGFCDEWGVIGSICHPQFMVDLMHKLDSLEEIKKKELYHLRSITPGLQYMGNYSEFDYYDVETQTLKYPYDEFREKIKEKLETQ